MLFGCVSLDLRVHMRSQPLHSKRVVKLCKMYRAELANCVGWVHNSPACCDDFFYASAEHKDTFMPHVSERFVWFSTFSSIHHTGMDRRRQADKTQLCMKSRYTDTHGALLCIRPLHPIDHRHEFKNKREIFHLKEQRISNRMPKRSTLSSPYTFEAFVTLNEL